MKVVMTGGHHTCALPVIDELKKRYPDVLILWFGHKRSLRGDKNDTLEYRDITSLNIPFYNLLAGKVYRTTNVLMLMRIPFGIVQSLVLLLKLKPDVILSFGGYLAAPVVFSGWILGIKSITHEQTTQAGYANRFISFFANKTLLTWPQSKSYFPEKKSVVTGLPLRKEIFLDTSNEFSLNRAFPTIYITAGKSGSHVINECVKDALGSLLSFCNVIHQCGDNSVFNDYDKLVTEYSKLYETTGGRYYPRKFVENNLIGEVYKKADIVVSRAGAHTIYELLALSKPAILIPISKVSHDEQTSNANVLVRSGLGVVVEESILTPDVLVSSVKDILFKAKHEKLTDGENTIVFNAEKLVVDELVNVFKKSKN